MSSKRKFSGCVRNARAIDAEIFFRLNGSGATLPAGAKCRAWISPAHQPAMMTVLASANVIWPIDCTDSAVAAIATTLSARNNTAFRILLMILC